MTREEAEQALAAAGTAPDERFPLFEACLSCALHENPARDPAQARTLADEAADHLRQRLRRERPEEAIGEALSGDIGVNGDLLTYSDPANADLISVCRARRVSSDGITTRPPENGSSAIGPWSVSIRSRKWPGKSTPSTGRAQRRAASR